MQTSLPDGSRIRRLCAAGAFLCAALMLSLAESIIFPSGLLPIPGAKPGFANAAVLLCAVFLGRRYAGAVSLCRVLLMFLLFGNAASVIYSLSGAFFSFLGICLFCRCPGLSFFGKSVIAAVLHNTAQLFCAVLLFGIPAISLAPWMILAAVFCGGISGTVLNLSYGAVMRVIGRSVFHNG